MKVLFSLYYTTLEAAIYSFLVFIGLREKKSVSRLP